MRRTSAIRALVLASVVSPFVATGAFADEPAPVPAPAAPVAPTDVPAPQGPIDPCCEVPPGCPCPFECLPDVLFKLPCIDACAGEFAKVNSASCLRLGAGAYHWWNYDTRDDDITYGYPGGGEGTYFYYFTGDLECKPCDPCGLTFGGHVELRARDQTPFRSFFDEQVWFYELYASASSPSLGKFKGGKIWKRFGLDWDGSFWGNVPYYDGYKLDPDWGFSWEKTWKLSPRLSMDTFAQFFVQEDEVNGSIAGADPESSDLFQEETTFVARAVPTWQFTKSSSLALGVSLEAGNIDHESGAGSDNTTVAGAVDLTYTWCGLKAYAEVIVEDGERNPAHYVTGGPSDSLVDTTIGVQYKFGPVTPRLTWSHGEYENPSGEQDIYLVGVTVEMTKWLTVYVEYVDWDVRSGGATTTFEDGFQFVLAWHF